MDQYKNNSSTSMAAQDRPREKLLYRGINSLTDAELIAILIGTGRKNQPVVDLAQQILRSYKNNLNELAKCSVHDLTQIKGIGQAKALSLLAALELGKRQRMSAPSHKPKITSSQSAYQQLAPMMEHLNHEQFWVLYLNQANRLIERRSISSGGITGTIYDVRLVFKHALLIETPNLILSHNHPSGNLNPSQADKDITRRTIEAGKLMHLEVLDHLIISESGYFSFADEGLI